MSVSGKRSLNGERSGPSMIVYVGALNQHTAMYTCVLRYTLIGLRAQHTLAENNTAAAIAPIATWSITKTCDIDYQ